MGNAFIEESTLTAIGNAIRTKTGKSDLMLPKAMAPAILGIEPSITIVPWSTGTDEQIVAMVAAADRGEINLADYWSVGDIRTVHLSSTPALGVSEEQPEQDAEFVLMHAGEYKLNSAVASGRDTCSFVVGMKGCLWEMGDMDPSSSYTGSWDGCARRTWCNHIFRSAIPNSLVPIFKQFKTKTATTYNATTVQTSIDWFALPACKEIYGGTATVAGDSTTYYSNLTEFNALFQFEYYKTAANWECKTNTNGDVLHWVQRSPFYLAEGNFVFTYSGGGVDAATVMDMHGISPFGCI